MEHQESMTATSMAEPKRAIEAILLVSSEPTPASVLAQVLELPLDAVEEMCRELAMSYDLTGHGFQLVEVAGGWRYQTHPDLAPYVERFATDGMSARLSTAALETLAIVAYKQPISRAQVSAIRGVNVDAVLRTLVQRGYVEEVGRDTGAGQAVLFGTTQHFLERIGLNQTTDLPALGDFVPSAEVVEALEQTLKVDLDPIEPVIDEPTEPESKQAEPAESAEAEASDEPVAPDGGPADAETVEANASSDSGDSGGPDGLGLVEADQAEAEPAEAEEPVVDAADVEVEVEVVEAVAEVVEPVAEVVEAVEPDVEAVAEVVEPEVEAVEAEVEAVEPEVEAVEAVEAVPVEVVDDAEDLTDQMPADDGAESGGDDDHLDLSKAVFDEIEPGEVIIDLRDSAIGEAPEHEEAEYEESSYETSGMSGGDESTGGDDHLPGSAATVMAETTERVETLSVDAFLATRAVRTNPAPAPQTSSATPEPVVDVDDPIQPMSPDVDPNTDREPVSSVEPVSEPAVSEPAVSEPSVSESPVAEDELIEAQVDDDGQ